MRSAAAASSSRKKGLAIVGPIDCEGGISRVIKTVLACPELSRDFEVRLFNTSYYQEGSLLRNSVTLLFSLTRYLAALSRRRIDVAHIHTSYGRSFYRKLLFLAASSLFGVKSVLHFHTGRFEEHFLQAGGFRKRAFKWSLGRSSAVVVLCQAWKEGIERAYGVRNSLVIHNPLPFDPDEIPRRPKEADRDGARILYLGFMIKSKGIYDLLEVADLLRKESLDARILVAGKGEEEKAFLLQIQKRGLENVRFLGWLDDREKKSLIGLSDIFLLPSYYEGNNMSVLEAMAGGLPVVSTRVGGNPELIAEGESGFLLEPGDVHGLFEKLRELILDPDEGRRLGDRGKLRSERFRRESVAAEWRTLYAHVLGEE